VTIDNGQFRLQTETCNTDQTTTGKPRCSIRVINLCFLFDLSAECVIVAEGFFTFHDMLRCLISDHLLSRPDLRTNNWNTVLDCNVLGDSLQYTIQQMKAIEQSAIVSIFITTIKLLLKLKTCLPSIIESSTKVGELLYIVYK
jgi:hypothetical protein